MVSYRQYNTPPLYIIIRRVSGDSIPSFTTAVMLSQSYELKKDDFLTKASTSEVITSLHR
jgi:hypothetical protein